MSDKSTSTQMSPQSELCWCAHNLRRCFLSVAAGCSLPASHQRIPLAVPPLIKLRWPALCLVISSALHFSVSVPALLLCLVSPLVYAKQPPETESDLISVNVTGLRDKSCSCSKALL